LRRPTETARLAGHKWFSADFTFPVTALYKRGCQDKYFAHDQREWEIHLAIQPCVGVSFLEFPFSVDSSRWRDDVLRLLTRTSSVVVRCQPWFYLRLVAYSFFWLSEGAYGLSRDWQCSKHTLRLNAVMDTHPRTRASEEPKSSPEMNLGMKKFSTRRSSCLLFQIFSVETYSFLPNQQNDGSNLACQRKPGHRGFHSSC